MEKTEIIVNRKSFRRFIKQISDEIPEGESVELEIKNGMAFCLFSEMYIEHRGCIRYDLWFDTAHRLCKVLKPLQEQPVKLIFSPNTNSIDIICSVG